MNKEKHFQPTDSELEILQLLWQKGPSTVRHINEALNEHREVGYTTTLKLMQIMHDKSMVERDTNQRTHIYTAIIEEADTQKRLLNKFVDATFRGSPMKMVLQALGNHTPSEQELEDIKQLIQEIENKRQS